MHWLGAVCVVFKIFNKREKMRLFEEIIFSVVLSQVESQWVPPMGAMDVQGAPPLLPDGIRLPPRGVSMAGNQAQAAPAFPGAPVAIGAPPPVTPGFGMSPTGRFGVQQPQAAPPQPSFAGAPVAIGAPPPMTPGVQMSPDGRISGYGQPPQPQPPQAAFPPAPMFPGGPVVAPSPPQPAFAGAPVAIGAPPPMTPGVEMQAD